MKINKIAKYFIMALFMSCSLFTIGNAAFWYGNSKSISESVTNDDTKFDPVCYAGNKKYKSIEAAIEDIGTPSSATTIYVYPNLKNYDNTLRTVYIKNDITINSKVTLCLPYSDTSYDAGDSWSTQNNSDNNTFSLYQSFADSNTPTEAIYDENGNLKGYTNMTVTTARTTLVKLDDGKKITIENGGKLQIGGQAGYQAQYCVSGGVNGNYAELRLGNGSQIIAKSGAIIDCYGYIKQDKEKEKEDPDDLEMVILEDGATLNTMLTIYDYKGGTRTTNLIGSSVNIMPFYIYDISCLQTKVRMFAGASVYVSARMEVSVIISTISLNETMQFFGDENAQTCLFKLSSGYIDMEYFPSDDERQTTDIHGTTKVDIYGEVSLDYVYFTKSYYMTTITVDSSKYDFPFNHKYELYACKDSIVNVSYNVKFLPGSKFVIDEGATFNVSSNSTIKIYERYQYAQSNGSLDGRWYTNGAQKGPAVFINNGTLTGNGCVAGLVQTEVTGATLNSNNFKSLSASVNENPNDKYNSAVANTYDSSYSFKGYLSSSATSPTNLEKAMYESKDKYWEKIEASNTVKIDVVSSDLTNNATAAGEGGTVILKAVTTGSNVLKYEWSLNNDGGTLSSFDTQEVTLTINANETASKVDLVIATVKVTFESGTPIFYPGVTSAAYTRTPKSSGGGCLIPGSLVTLADGTTKVVDNIVAGDELLVFNHETGELDIAPVIFNDYEPKELLNVTYLNFSNGSNIGVIYEHGFFDVTLNKYVYIDEFNAFDYLGHEFYTEEGNVAILDSINIIEEYTECYSPVTAYHLNYFVDGMLSMPGGIEGLFNIFKYDSNLKYDEEKKQNDIERYGLFTYEDFKDLMPYEAYCMFPAPYLKVAIGKGMLTFEQILSYIERYEKFWL